MIGNRWVALFSRTGSEIVNLIDRTGKVPDVIVSNKPFEKRYQINHTLLTKYQEKVIYIPNNPTYHDYVSVLGKPENTIITCHGWLRVIPTQVCNEYNIFNGHPGLVDKYPELRGKDPQLKVQDGSYETVGSVIHKVTPKVDAGKIIKSKEIEFDNFTKNNIFEVLADVSLSLWVEFINEVKWLKG